MKYYFLSYVNKSAYGWGYGNAYCIVDKGALNITTASEDIRKDGDHLAVVITNFIEISKKMYELCIKDPKEVK